MIFLKIRGGAGNQFSQYAYVRALIHKRGDNDKLWIDDSGIYSTVFNDYLEDHLQWFNTYPYEIKRKPKKWLLLRIICRLIRQMFKQGTMPYIKGHEWLARHGVCSIEGIEYCNIIPKTKDVYVEGNFENSKYYDTIRHILLSEFTVKKQFPIRTNKILNKIKSRDSICISIRIWPKEEISTKRQQQTELFYKRAVNEICKKTNRYDYQLILFSNDPEFCKSLFVDQDAYIEDGDGTIYEKLYMMSKCKHFVLSNSTFSWWAQYLSTNKDKIVVLPYCPDLGFFKFRDPPSGVRKENWILLDSTSGERIN